MKKRFIIYKDIRELDRIALNANFAFLDLEPHKTDIEKIDRVKRLLRYLPKKDVDILNLYFFNGLNQNTIGKLFYISQGDVSFKLKRACKRLEFLFRFPIFKGSDRRLMRERLYSIFKKTKDRKEDVKIMMTIYDCTSQTKAAKLLGINQSKCRYRFYRCLKLLKEASKREPERFQIYYDAFRMIRSNYNILRHLHPQQRWIEKEENAKKIKCNNKNKIILEEISNN